MRKRRVVVYDDDAILQSLYRTFLTALDYEVLVFPEPLICPLYSGSSDVCANTHPCADAMITDFNMPRMNGVELLLAQYKHGCKLTPRNKALLSGDIDRERIAPILELGCAFFQRPFPLSELADWLSVCEQRVRIDTPLGIQRREPRLPFTRQVLCWVQWYTAPLAGFGVNISASGLCLKLPLPLQDRELVRLPIDLPFPSSSGTVRWSKEHDDGMYLTGLQCV